MLRLEHCQPPLLQLLGHYQPPLLQLIVLGFLNQ
jgi:hypothetical protein